jgi:hypothetical protein
MVCFVHSQILAMPGIQNVHSTTEMTRDSLAFLKQNSDSVVFVIPYAGDFIGRI